MREIVDVALNGTAGPIAFRLMEGIEVCARQTPGASQIRAEPKQLRGPRLHKRLAGWLVRKETTFHLPSIAMQLHGSSSWTVLEVRGETLYLANHSRAKARENL